LFADLIGGRNSVRVEPSGRVWQRRRRRRHSKEVCSGNEDRRRRIPAPDVVRLKRRQIDHRIGRRRRERLERFVESRSHGVVVHAALAGQKSQRLPRARSRTRPAAGSSGQGEAQQITPGLAHSPSSHTPSLEPSRWMGESVFNLDRVESVAGAGLAPHLDLALPRGARHRGKGVHIPGLPLNVGSSGRATSRRGLGVVWPVKDPS